MHTVTTIGLDIAKSVFQVHGIDAAGQVVTPTSNHCRYRGHDWGDVAYGTLDRVQASRLRSTRYRKA
jgi:hypothetical protein